MKYLAAMPYRLLFFILLSLLLVSCGKKELQQANTKLQKQIDHLIMEVQKLRLENARLREVSGEDLQIGFEVQVGAFEHFDISAYSDELVRFKEVNADGVYKYVLGQFSRYEDAETFLEDIKKMGMKDAFIAGIVNGERSTVSSAKVAAREYYGYE